jgi:drug/metabolite transporter (DMT)-like permease
MAAIGIPGSLLYYMFYYAGTDILPASQAFIINYLWPIMSVIFACIILKEKMTLRKGLAIAISFLGVITVAGEGLFSFNKEAILGVGLCILAAISYGAFTALTKRWSYDEGLSLMISFFSSFVLSGVISIFLGEKIQVGIPQMLGFAYNGIAIMAIATVTWALALKGGNTAKVSNLAYITPFLSLVWTFFILHEPINPLSVLGLGIIILGIFIQLKGKKK